MKLLNKDSDFKQISLAKQSKGKIPPVDRDPVHINWRRFQRRKNKKKSIQIINMIKGKIR
jgi:hypothetical protein